MRALPEEGQYNNPEVEEQLLTTSWLKGSKWWQELEEEVFLLQTTSVRLDKLQEVEGFKLTAQTGQLRL